MLDARAGPVRNGLTRYFGRRVRNSADVEDMVQDVFLRIAARDSTGPEPRRRRWWRCLIAAPCAFGRLVRDIRANGVFWEAERVVG